MALITLTTDFGYSDANVGILKGIIYAINPTAQVIDITHHLQPLDVAQGAFILHIFHRHFPPGTIHLGLVGGVPNTNKSAICLEVPEVGVFIGQDNGLFSYILDTYPNVIARGLTNSLYFREQTFNPFQELDILGPVAAYLSRGVAVNEVGIDLYNSELTLLDDLKPKWETYFSRRVLVGKIVHIDNFGNIISNIPGKMLEQYSDKVLDKVEIGASPHIEAPFVGPLTVKTVGIKRAYTDVSNGKLIALIGNNGYLELVRVNGAAAFEKVAVVPNNLAKGINLKRPLVEVGGHFAVQF